MRTPAKFSCASVVKSLKCAWTASNLSWILRPSKIAITGSKSIETTAIAVKPITTIISGFAHILAPALLARAKEL